MIKQQKDTFGLEAFELEGRPASYQFKNVFSKRAPYGMRVLYGRTITPSRSIVIEHYELSCPGHELNANNSGLADAEVEE